MELKIFLPLHDVKAIAEIYDGSQEWAEITLDPTTGKFVLELFPQSSGRYDLGEVLRLLVQAEHRLLELEVPGLAERLAKDAEDEAPFLKEHEQPRDDGS